MVAGFGRKGHAKGDIPGVRFKIVSVIMLEVIKLFWFISILCYLFIK